uniref:Uncharacterized protein n=1 Tax=Rhizophora mucronata TaxID=61149 RepID=A0A2P2M2Y1_RHIMU
MQNLTLVLRNINESTTRHARKNYRINAPFYFGDCTEGPQLQFHCLLTLIFALIDRILHCSRLASQTHKPSRLPEISVHQHLA